MNASLGRITAHLADIAPDRLDQLAELINQNINPPDSVKSSEVYVRAMYLASEEINSFGGRFPLEELQRLAELMVDSPVLVGHRKDRLPVGRTFLAEIVQHRSRTWVKSYFYWLRGADGGQTLKENIDGGIYKECSVGFTFQFPECSICGQDIRNCEHEPFSEYSAANGSQSCHFLYRKVERVLESSLVYRGAVPGTSVTKELIETSDRRTPAPPHHLNHPAELDMTERYLVAPNYAGLAVTVSHDKGALKVVDGNGCILPEGSLSLDGADLAEFSGIPAILIGLRGKERCAEGDVRRYVDAKGGPVSRTVIKLYPTLTDNGYFSAYGGNKSIGVIPHAVVTVNELDSAARQLMTREGVRIWSTSDTPDTPGHTYLPASDGVSGKSGYQLKFGPMTADAILSFYDLDNSRSFLIKQFNMVRFRRGARYLCDEIPLEEARKNKPATAVFVGPLEVRNGGDSLIMKLGGQLNETVVVQPIRINGMRRHLFYCIDSGVTPVEDLGTIDLTEEADE